MLKHLTDTQLDRKIEELRIDRLNLLREIMYTNGLFTMKGRLLSSVRGKANISELDYNNAKAEKERRKK